MINIEEGQLLNRRKFLAGGAVAAGAAVTGGITTAHALPVKSEGKAFKIVNLEKQDLQTTISEAADHAILVCQSDHPITVQKSIIISRPLTLVGLRARLADDVEKTELLIVNADDVAIEHFDLKGNAATVGQSSRRSLIRIQGDRFRVENGRVSESANHGILVRTGRLGDAKKSDRNVGVIRNIVGRRIGRDVVSITGRGNHGVFVNNVLVENIWGYGPSLRGTVETADGTHNITIRNIYADSCSYGIDVQDHSKPGQKNSNITIDGVFVTNCIYAIATRARPYGHRNLTIRNVTGENWSPNVERRWTHIKPITIRHTDNVHLENIRITDNSDIDGVDIYAYDSHGLTLKNTLIERANHSESSIVIQDCNNVDIDGVRVVDPGDNIRSAVEYSITEGSLKNLQITRVCAPDMKEGIVIKRSNTNFTLENYAIHNNLTRVSDNIDNRSALVNSNLT